MSKPLLGLGSRVCLGGGGDQFEHGRVVTRKVLGGRDWSSSEKARQLTGGSRDAGARKDDQVLAAANLVGEQLRFGIDGIDGLVALLLAEIGSRACHGVKRTEMLTWRIS